MRRERSAKKADARPQPSARIKLPRPTGGHIDIYGDPDAQQIVLMVGRDDFLQDEELVGRLIAFFTARGRTVAQYQSRHEETRRLATPGFTRSWPRNVRGSMIAVRLLLHPDRWLYLVPGYWAYSKSVPSQAAALRVALRSFSGREVALLGRSAGARVCTLIADECGVKRVVALSYPFKHPKQPPDPDRYRHLADLRTSLLIVQGARDEYGGASVATLYALSSTTSVEVVDTDHNMHMREDSWQALTERIYTHLSQP